MVKALAILFALCTALPAPAQVQKIVTPVDPLALASPDFRRLASPALWDGLSVSRIEFRDGRTFWRAYRIVNARKSTGPLWFVPHDNENAAFQAAIFAVRSYGGVVIAVEEARSVDGPDSRENGDVDYGSPVDPNRSFYAEAPTYADAILADLGARPRLIVALHTNEAGYDAWKSSCLPRNAGDTGKGDISILLCSDTFAPRRSVARAWPYDDTDSVAIVAVRSGADLASGYCARPMVAADMNVIFERVVTSDGSLSNYALFRGLPYVNLETQERGVDPVGLAVARGRLLGMIETVMTRCSPIEGLGLRPPVYEPPAAPKRKRKRWF